jgi:hypothetical protein
MKRTDFEFDDAGGQATDVAGTTEGDGDFETDDLPSTGETSSGGQVTPTGDTRDGIQGRKEDHDRDRTGHGGGLSRVIDQVSSGKILP